MKSVEIHDGDFLSIQDSKWRSLNQFVKQIPTML